MARILLVSWNYPPAIGGIESFVSDAVRMLSSRHEVTVLTRESRGSAPVPGVVRLPARTFGAFAPRAFVRTLRLLSSGAADLVVAGSGTAATVTAAAAALTRTPAAVCCMGLDIVYPNPLYQALLRPALRAHRAVVAISENTRALAIGRGVDPARTLLIPPGVSASLLDLIRDAPPPAVTRARHGLDGRPVLLSVGRLIPRKGLHRFVRTILPLVRREIPEALLLIAGDDTTTGLTHRQGERALVEAAVAELGLQGNVRFTGLVDAPELAALYRAADLFVFPAVEIPGDVEGFGIVTVEAAAAGIPAVVSGCGGIPDTVDDGVSGIVTAPGDDAAFAAGVVALLRDDDRRRAMGRAARDRALRLYAPEALTARWLELVDRILAPGHVDRVRRP